MQHARSRLSAVARSAVPAYAFPAVTAYLNAQVILDPDLSARLESASYSTIAIPSAIAAALVTLWLHGRTRALPRARVVAVAVLVCVALAGAVSAVLIGNGLQDISILQFTLGSAALGGGLSAWAWVRRAPVHTGRTPS